MAPAQQQSDATEEAQFSTDVRGTIVSAIAFTHIELEVPEFGMTGRGTAFGPGLQGTAFQGKLIFDDWFAVFRNGDLQFEIAAGGVAGAGTVVNFSAHGQHVATIVGVGAGLGGAIGVVGTFHWN